MTSASPDGVLEPESATPSDSSAALGATGPAVGGGAAAFLVASGILLSRLVGLVRQRVFAHYFGTSAVADVFTAAFRIPNFLQNLFGEGVLSASFIPVYASLIARGEEREASRVAGAIGALLGLVVAFFVLLGILATPALVLVIAPGFSGEKRELAIRLVRILFPGAGLLVLSAWCLGVLNSHRRFFLSYVAPVVWNVSMIAALLVFGGREGQVRLAELLAWASVTGSALQFLVQLPTVLRLVPHLVLALDMASEHVRTVVRNFGPVFVGRGVVQISAYVDSLLATLLVTGSVAVLNYAQILYTLPVSLFGMAVSAAELPAMASATGDDATIGSYLRSRLDAGLRRIAFFIVPSAMAFLALGDVIAGAVYRSGRFGREEALWVWGALAGATVGLLASTLGRLYASAYYALRDTRTPLRFAVIRVVLTTALGYLFALPLPRWLGVDPRWGVAGLTLSAGLAGWIEFFLLRRSLTQRLGPTGLRLGYQARLWGAAAAAAAVGYSIKLLLGEAGPVVLAIPVVAAYGVTYLGLTAALGVQEAAHVGRLLGRAMGRRRQR
jgi:putative peptidoglycan lipid II flippase